MQQAERFIERVGFAACLTDSRRSGPSLYVAVCGRRDAVMPRNVQTDPEASQTWLLKDEIIRRGKVYYAKLSRGKATFIAPRMLPYFAALWGVKRADEKKRLGAPAQAVLRVLRREWEMATSDLRVDAKVADRARFTKAMDELQAAMLVVPSEVLYQPSFTYLWTLAVGRFPDALTRRVPRATGSCVTSAWPNRGSPSVPSIRTPGMAANFLFHSCAMALACSSGLLRSSHGSSPTNIIAEFGKFSELKMLKPESARPERTP